MSVAFHIADLPDRPDDRGPWLDRMLTGFALGELIEELTVLAEFAASEGDAPSSGEASGALERVLGDDRTAVLERGLVALPPERLTPLLTRPALLSELQMLVFAEGGAYWHGLLGEDGEVAAAADRAFGPAADAADPGSTPPPARSPPARTPAPRRRWPVAALSALAAAALLVTVAVVFRPADVPPASAVAWGWAGPDGLPEADTAPAYLDALADAADAWFNKRPTDRAALATRITEFRAGCDVLIAADHGPLPPAAADRLRAKCRAWAGKLDAQLADLKAGADLLEVRERTDDTVLRLIAALRGGDVLRT